MPALLILTIDRIEPREDDIFGLTTIRRPLEDALLGIQRHLARSYSEPRSGGEGSFEIKWSRLFPDPSYGLVAYLELHHQGASIHSEAYGDRVIEALLDTSTCPQFVRDRLHEVSGELPLGTVMFIGSEGKPRKAMIKPIDEFLRKRRDSPDFQPRSAKAPFESPQDVLDFFQACAELDGPDVESDWSEHLRVINEARSKGVSSS